jgi:hypothetical protein
MSNFEDLRSQLEQRLGTQLPGGVWGYLAEEGLIEKTMKREIPLSHLENLARALLAEPSHPIPMLSTADIAQALKRENPRQAIISRLLATEAEKELQVEEFRAKVMGGRLMPWEEVHEWIQQQALKDGPLPSWYYPEMRVPPAYQEQYLDAPTGQEPSLEFPPIAPKVVSKKYQVRELKYGVLAGSWPKRSVAVVEGKPLEQLRVLSLRLADKYRWMEEQAAIFVLTGLTPFVDSLTFEIALKEVATASRIILIVDPALPPEELADSYRAIRQMAGGSRQREMSKKHLVLALFAATRPKGETWAAGMIRWNREHPEWAYQHETNFGRDAGSAQRRLLYPSYHIQAEEDNGEESER